MRKIDKESVSNEMVVALNAAASTKKNDNNDEGGGGMDYGLAFFRIECCQNSVYHHHYCHTNIGDYINTISFCVDSLGAALFFLIVIHLIYVFY